MALKSDIETNSRIAVSRLTAHVYVDLNYFPSAISAHHLIRSRSQRILLSNNAEKF